MSNLGKYETKNPFKRFLLSRFLDRARSAVPNSSDVSLLDVGTGEGLFWKDAPRQKRVGIDIRLTALTRAFDEQGILPVAASATLLPFRDKAFDFVTAVEIFEHLEDPGSAAAEISRVSRGGGLVTVPWEPWFSLLVLVGTGKHWRRIGREEEHIQAFGPAQLQALLVPHFTSVQVDTCFPWLIASMENSKLP
jgi:ubiquinone/menaquinone biosynthesis C-methylase UbiE